MRSILFRTDTDSEQFLLAELADRGIAGIVEEAEGLRAYFVEPEVFAAALVELKEFVISSRIDEQSALVAFERDDWDPILIGERFFVVPSWTSHATPAGRHRIVIDSEWAFGTGRHESTQLVMRAMEQHVVPGVTVLDIGCGSGILSMAALALGADRVYSCDVHPDAVDSAAGQLVTPVFRGTVDSIRDGVADVVVANISANVIDVIADDLNRITRPGGCVLLAGFIDGKTPVRFTPEQVYEQDGWLCWLSHARRVEGTPTDYQGHIRQFTERWW